MKFALKILAVLILMCATAVATAFAIKKLYVTESQGPQITSAFVEQQISEIAELATLHHHYRKNANYQDAKKLLKYMPDWRINKSIKEFMLIYQGDVKLGYDLKDIKINVEPITKTILIYLPEPKILSHSIDFESIEVFGKRRAGSTTSNSKTSSNSLLPNRKNTKKKTAMNSSAGLASTPSKSSAFT